MKVLSSRAILIFKVFREKELQVAIGSAQWVAKKIRVVKNTAIVIVLITLWIIISQNQSCMLKCNVEFSDSSTYLPVIFSENIEIS